MTAYHWDVLDGGFPLVDIGAGMLKLGIAPGQFYKIVGRLPLAFSYPATRSARLGWAMDDVPEAVSLPLPINNLVG